jgi:hypothetical protein
MSELKLLAFDEEDLQVVSAHLQDALLRGEDMTWQPRGRRFAMLVSRFDWEQALVDDERSDRLFERCRCALRFDKVDAVKVKNLKPGAGGQVLELLAITYEAQQPPAGHIELVFAGNRSVRLDVECIEAEVTDLGEHWTTHARPQHK